MYFYTTIANILVGKFFVVGIFFFFLSFWKQYLMCWPPHAEQKTCKHSHTIIFKKAIKAKLLSLDLDKMAEYPHFNSQFSMRAHFFHSDIWPPQNFLNWFNLCSCFSNMYYHNAFNFFLTYYLQVLSKGLLPSAESVCAVWLEYRWIGPSGPWAGDRVGGCQLKDMSDPNNRWNCCICL